jgi:hypothetical protein
MMAVETGSLRWLIQSTLVLINKHKIKVTIQREILIELLN